MKVYELQRLLAECGGSEEIAIDDADTNWHMKIRGVRWDRENRRFLIEGEGYDDESILPRAVGAALRSVPMADYELDDDTLVCTTCGAPIIEDGPLIGECPNETPCKQCGHSIHDRGDELCAACRGDD